MAGIKHKKTNTVPAWTQADIDTQIALGNVPPGTLLSGFTVSTDWNEDHSAPAGTPIGYVPAVSDSSGTLTFTDPGSVVGYKQLFLATTDFTPGVTTALTISSNKPASATNLLISFDAGEQLLDQWSYNAGTGVVTFTSPIPVGTKAVQMVWGVYTGSGGGGGSGTVTDVSVVTANGLSGTVATSTTTPAITLGTTVTGLVKGNGTALSAATAGTDYSPPMDVQDFNASGTWNMPTGAKMVEVYIVGGGGGAGGGGLQPTGSAIGGGGGGGGACGVVFEYLATDLTSSVTVTVGAGGTGGAGRGGGIAGNGTNGSAGSNSSFGTYLVAYGGGAGGGGQGNGSAGGGGASMRGAGGAGSGVTGGSGASQAGGGGSATTGTNIAAFSAGSGGSGCTATGANSIGTYSFLGCGGGASGGGVTSANVAQNGGGLQQASSNSTYAQGSPAYIQPTGFGTGGTGGNGAVNTTAQNGFNGIRGGGGGGGGGANNITAGVGGNGGNGGDGWVRVITYF